MKKAKITIRIEFEDTPHNVVVERDIADPISYFALVPEVLDAIKRTYTILNPVPFAKDPELVGYQLSGQHQEQNQKSGDN